MHFTLLALGLSSQTATWSLYFILCTYIMDVFKITRSLWTEQRGSRPIQPESTPKEDAACYFTPQFHKKKKKKSGLNGW